MPKVTRSTKNAPVATTTAKSCKKKSSAVSLRKKTATTTAVSSHVFELSVNKYKNRTHDEFRGSISHTQKHDQKHQMLEKDFVNSILGTQSQFLGELAEMVLADDGVSHIPKLFKLGRGEKNAQKTQCISHALFDWIKEMKVKRGG